MSSRAAVDVNEAAPARDPRQSQAALTVGPRLLVSVRDVAEARAAVDGGADLIDVKEPRRGALGMADVAVIEEVAAFVSSTAPGTPVSAALGELRDWGEGAVNGGFARSSHRKNHHGGTEARRQTSDTISAVCISADYRANGLRSTVSNTSSDEALRLNDFSVTPCLRGEKTGSASGPASGALSRVRFFKLGLAGERSSGGWVRRWADVRLSVGDRSSPGARWVAVAYADARDADAPSPERVIDAAVQGACAGLLIDTYRKSPGGLFRHVTAERLGEWARLARSGGLFVAAAGGLDADGIRRLAGVPVDVVAVRSAACEASRRDGPVSARRVRRLRRQVTALTAAGAASS